MNVYRKALETYGIDPQLKVTAEECAELIQAIMKHLNLRGAWQDVVLEAVDVLLMINQIREIAGSDYFDTLVKNRLEEFDVRLNAERREINVSHHRGAKE